MYCKYCGKKVSDQVKFCPYCGKALKPSEKVIEGKIIKESKMPESAHVKASHKETDHKQKQVEQDVKETTSKKTPMIIALCVVSLTIACVGLGMTNSNSSVKAKSQDVVVIDQKKYYSNDELNYTEDFRYNSSGLIGKIYEYGTNLNDTDEKTFTYKNHFLLSMNDTCPSGKDNTITWLGCQK